MYDELGVAYKDQRMVLREQPPHAGMLERPDPDERRVRGELEVEAGNGRGARSRSSCSPGCRRRSEAPLDGTVERFGARLELVSPGG